MRTRKTTLIHVRVSQEIHNRIFSTAEKLGITPSELIRQAIILYLNKLEKGEGND